MTAFANTHSIHCQPFHRIFSNNVAGTPASYPLRLFRKLRKVPTHYWFKNQTLIPQDIAFESTIWTLSSPKSLWQSLLDPKEPVLVTPRMPARALDLSGSPAVIFLYLCLWKKKTSNKNFVTSQCLAILISFWGQRPCDRWSRPAWTIGHCRRTYSYGMHQSRPALQVLTRWRASNDHRCYCHLTSHAVNF